MYHRKEVNNSFNYKRYACKLPYREYSVTGIYHDHDTEYNRQHRAYDRNDRAVQSCLACTENSLILNTPVMIIMIP